MRAPRNQIPISSAGHADITALYTARYGAPVEGQKVFVRCYQMVDGYKTIPQVFSAIVPAAT